MQIRSKNSDLLESTKKKQFKFVEKKQLSRKSKYQSNDNIFTVKVTTYMIFYNKFSLR